MSDYIRGWEIMYCLHKENVKTKLDLMLLVVHFGLMKHGFLALAFTTDAETYDAKTHGAGKESLPPGWSDFGSNFVLNYAYQEKHYRLRCGSSSGLVVFNLIEQGEEPQVSSVLLNIDTEIQTVDEQLLGEIVNLEDILKKIEQDLIQPFVDKNSKAIHTQTDPEKAKKKVNQPGLLGNPDMGIVPLPINMQPLPLNVGSSDLYPALGRPLPIPFIPRGIPTGHGGGGMIFDPFSTFPPGFNPPGYIPGARFDPIGVQPPNPLRPFGPPPPGRYQPGFEPDPDHLPPPGYDDMFM